MVWPAISPLICARVITKSKLPSRRWLSSSQAALILFLACGLTVNGLGQQLPVGPMGLIQEARPSLKVPKAVRSLLPRGAEVKLLQVSQFNPEDTLVVYETRRPTGLEKLLPSFHITRPTVVVLRANRIVARFKICKPFTIDVDWVFLSGGEFRLSPERSAAVFAFRTDWDGSDSAYLILSAHYGKYRVLMNYWASQTSLRVLDGNGNFDLWEAIPGDCVWCRHRYKIIRYKWNDRGLVRVSRRVSRGKLLPSVVAGRPLILPPSLDLVPQHVARGK